MRVDARRRAGDAGLAPADAARVGGGRAVRPHGRLRQKQQQQRATVRHVHARLLGRLACSRNARVLLEG